MVCNKVVPIVNGLAEDYAGKLEFEVVSADADGARERIEHYGFDRHGMVLVDQDDNVLWSENSHNQKRATIAAEIDKALGG